MIFLDDYNYDETNVETISTIDTSGKTDAERLSESGTIVESDAESASVSDTIVKSNAVEIVDKAYASDSYYLNSRWIRLPPVDFSDPEDVVNRINVYFADCFDQNLPPTAAGLAFALGCDRTWLSAAANGVYSEKISPKSLEAVKTAFRLLSAVMEEKILLGEVKATVGMFLMKNNLNYQDHVSLSVSSTDPLGEKVPVDEIMERWKYLL